MLLYPAIDLLDGKAVRLLRGSRSDVTVYYNDPLEAARKMADCGASHLHIVDLDGAFDGVQRNLATVERIAAMGVFYIELGGGVRDAQAAKRAYDCGADRVIIGTAAFGPLAGQLPGGRVACGIDARKGMVSVRGWTQDSDVTAGELARKMLGAGVADIIYTDIARDGAMSGPNIDELKKMTAIEGLRITASGGVSKMSDLSACRKAGAHAAIIGKAFYEGAIDLARAVELFQEG